jgi:hypothetical protein
MTSERKRQANRANAQASTGPKTASGKKRSALNARQHGLNMSVLHDPVLVKEVEVLARQFAGTSSSAEVLYCARRVAEAQVDLQRVRAYRLRYIRQALADPNFVGITAEELHVRLSIRWIELERRGHFPAWGFAHLNPEPLEGPQKLATIFSDLVRHMSVLERYERRALSRRRLAIRDLDAAQRGEREHGPGAGRTAAAPVLH